MKRFLTMCVGILLLGLVTPPLALAQAGYEVKGVVVDKSGAPILGATVIEKGTTNGVSTGLDGDYAIRVASPEAVVVVNYIGYKTVELVATSTELANLTLEEDAMGIDDVVVIGYGVVKKNDMTGSVATVKADQLNKGVVSSPIDLMRGKSAGVVITAGSGAPGSASTILIRGGASLNATNDPLVVIDGLPVSGDGISGVGDALASVNPSDIESFTVLKDASATAIFGSRASNGVILITTKKGSRGESAAPRVSVDFTASLSQNAKYVDVLTGDQMRSLIEQQYGLESDTYKALGTANTDWQKEIFQLAQSYEGNVSLTGNVKMGEKSTMPYRVSFGYLNQDGTLKTSSLQRETLSINLNPQLLDNHLTINLNAKGMIMDSRFANEGAVGEAVRYDPTQSVYDENGLNGYTWWNYGKEGDLTVGNANTMATSNPVATLFDKIDESNAKRFIGNAQIDYRIHGLEDWRLNLNLGLDFSKSNGDVDVAPGTEQSMHNTSQAGSGYHSNYSQLRRDQTLEFYLDYTKTIERHSFGIMAGYSWQHFFQSSFNEQFRADDTDPEDQAYYLSMPKVSKGENFLVSYFGRINYSFDNRYMLTATLRRDGTSRFANNQWGLFPSVALGWNIAQEKFLKDSKALSALKLRLSWGQTGQQKVGNDNDALATYITNTLGSYYPFGSNNVFVPITPAGYNADLKWETTTTWNAGIDFGFLDGRINGSVDFYKRETTDMLSWTPVPAGSNLTNYLNANIGDMENTGVEIDLNFIPLQTENWQWSIGVNGAWNKTEITKLSADDGRDGYYGIDTGGIAGGTGNTIQVHQAGQTPYSFYVYQQVYDANGKPIEGLYVDRNKDGVVNDQDKYCFEKSAPDFTLGFNTQLSWRNLTLAVSGHGSFGNYVYNNIESNGVYLGDLWANSFVANRVSAVLDNPMKTAQYHSDFYVRDASFFKIDNVTLSYRFSLGKSSRNPSLSVFGTVQNVCTFTGYEGIDPEIFSGIDNNMYPRPRTYILGVKFNF